MTVLGFQSVAELRDLLAASDAKAKQLGDQWRAAADKWKAAAAADAYAFEREYNAFTSRYASARRAASAVVTAESGLGDAYKPVPDAAYLGVLRAFCQGQTTIASGCAQQPGDFNDLVQRLSAVASISFTVAQPKAQDADLEVYKVADKATKAIEVGGGALGKVLLGAALGAGAGLLVAATAPALLVGAAVGAGAGALVGGAGVKSALVKKGLLK